MTQLDPLLDQHSPDSPSSTASNCLGNDYPETDDPTTEVETSSPSQSLGSETPSYVKLAMRNMVKKGGKSLFHFSLSAIGLLTLLVGLAYLTR